MQNEPFEDAGPMIGTKPLPTDTFKVASAAFLCALFFTILGWSKEWPFNKPRFLTGTDDLLRMVNVRDLMAGQGWYDLTQYRLGLTGGTMMHWSRLVDLPIAILVKIGTWVDPGNGEILAATLWPLLLFVLGMMGFMIGAGRIAGKITMLYTMVIGGFALVASGGYETGSIDHHNVQLSLGLWLITLILPSPTEIRDFTIAGVLASLMLAIGMESLPIIIAAGAAVIVRLIAEGEDLVPAVRGFGLSLAISLTVLFFALVGPQNYGAGTCDAYSLFHVGCGAIGGLSLYVGLSDAVRSRLPRPFITVPVLAALASLIIAFVFFRPCLADPYANLDPKLKMFWLDSVFEAQSAYRISQLDPWLLLSLFAMPLLAMGWLILSLISGKASRSASTMLIVIVISTAVTVFQMRGAGFSTPFSALALAGLVIAFAQGTGKQKPLPALGLVLASTAITWKLLTVVGISLFSGGHSGPLIAGANTISSGASCHSEQSLASLKAEPDGTVAAANGLGPDILFATPHRVLAGPYHRNVDGNLAWINAMIGTPGEARQILTDAEVTLLAVCPDDPDERDFLRAAPDGFVGQLLKGQTFNWIEPVQQTMELPLRVWRIKKQ